MCDFDFICFELVTFYKPSNRPWPWPLRALANFHQLPRIWARHQRWRQWWRRLCRRRVWSGRCGAGRRLPDSHVSHQSNWARILGYRVKLCLIKEQQEGNALTEPAGSCYVLLRSSLGPSIPNHFVKELCTLKSIQIPIRSQSFATGNRSKCFLDL